MLRQMNLVVPAFSAEDFAVTGDIVFSLGPMKEGEPATVEALKEFVPGNLFLFRGKIDADGFAVRCVLDPGGMAAALFDPVSDSAVIRRRAEPAHETLLSNSNATSITPQRTINGIVPWRPNYFIEGRDRDGRPPLCTF
ncbi:hypothetical protein ACVIDN_003142 [Rhizobium brockwellii]